MSNTLLAKSAIRKAFPGINDTEVETMLEISKLAEYPAEICLCQEGKVEETFYILLDGEVRVTKEISSDEDRLLNTLAPGDFFGEMGLIHDAPRAASVTTNLKVKVLEIDKSSFNQTLQKMSMVSVAMVREVSQRLRDNDEMAIEDLREKAGRTGCCPQRISHDDCP
jgi:CRP/FNR family cyclic AMP-dependent transcriptional regulator